MESEAKISPDMSLNGVHYSKDLGLLSRNACGRLSFRLEGLCPNEPPVHQAHHSPPSGLLVSKLLHFTISPS